MCLKGQFRKSHTRAKSLHTCWQVWMLRRDWCIFLPTEIIRIFWTGMGNFWQTWRMMMRWSAVSWTSSGRRPSTRIMPPTPPDPHSPDLWTWLRHILVHHLKHQKQTVTVFLGAILKRSSKMLKGLRCCYSNLLRNHDYNSRFLSSMQLYDSSQPETEACQT